MARTPTDAATDAAEAHRPLTLYVDFGTQARTARARRGTPTRARAACAAAAGDAPRRRAVPGAAAR